MMRSIVHDDRLPFKAKNIKIINSKKFNHSVIICNFYNSMSNKIKCLIKIRKHTNIFINIYIFKQ